jgi:putative membrane protein
MMYGYGGWWMGLMMLLFWGGLIALIVWVIQTTQSHRAAGGSVNTGSRAMHILEERFARGEIDQEEFDQRKRTLESR